MRRIWLTLKGIAKHIIQIITVVLSGNDSLLLESAIEDGLNSVTLSGKCSFLAEGYQQVEYIQGTGNQYIDTGFVIPDMTDDYQIDMKLMVDGGTASGTQSNNLGYMGINSVLMLVYTRDYGIGISSDGVPYVADHISDISFKRGSDLSRSVTVDGTVLAMSNQPTLYADRPFGIFRLSPFDQTYNKIYGKIYEFKAYHNGELVMNLVPCRRLSDSVLGMYDTINKTFLTNAGTGTFTAGNDIIPTPTAPLPIQCNNGQINIFCGEKFSKSGQTTGEIINSDGSISANSSYNITAPRLLKKGVYTVTFKDTVSSSGRIFRAYDYTDPNNPVRIFNSSSGQGSANTLISFTLNLNTDRQNVRVCYRTSMSSISIKPDNPIITIDGPTETVEDEIGNTATAEMLLGVTNGTTTIKDTQEVLSGAITRNIGFKIFTSADVVEYQSTNQRFVLTAGSKQGLGNRAAPLFCTHFQTIDDSRPIGEVPNMSIYGASTDNLYVKYTSYSAKTAFGNWLDSQFNAGTPVVVIYPLNTPTTETVNGQTLTTIEGDNTIEIIQAHLEGLPIEVSYQKQVIIS